jgi:hypothetical protein
MVNKGFTLLRDGAPRLADSASAAILAADGNHPDFLTKLATQHLR